MPTQQAYHHLLTNIARPDLLADLDVRAVDGAEERSLPHGETKPRDDNLALVAQLADRVNRKNAICLVVCGAATQELVACLLTEFVTLL